jgi:hypothetical protein
MLVVAHPVFLVTFLIFAKLNLNLVSLRISGVEATLAPVSGKPRNFI